MTIGRVPLFVVAVLAAIALWFGTMAAVRREEANLGRIRALQVTNARLEDEAGRIDTVYRADTITLRKVRYATDTLLARDTVIHTDTVRQIVAEERRACSAVIATCEQKQANLLARLANRDSVIAVQDAEKPGWFKRTFGCTAGASATTKGTGLGITCGAKVL